MSDVGDTTLTDTYVLVADGDSFESRALVEADISDLGTYLEDITGESIFDLSDVTANPDADKYPKWDYDPGELVWVDATGFTDLTDFDEQTAWRLFYSNADGDVTELALGDDNTYLMSNGASAAPTFETPAGGGTVTTSGTPEVNDIARFTGATVIEGLTYDELTTALALNSDDLSDVASIAMLDEAETIPGDWTFLDYLTVQRTTDNPTLSASIYFEKIRDGTPTSDVSSGDELGRFVFTGYHTGFYHDAAKISALVDGDPGANDMPGRLEFFTTPDDSDTPVLRKTIDSSGNHKMGDGAWTNYVNTTAGGVMTAEGTATITATNLVPKQEIDFGAHSAGFTQQTLTGDGATLIDWTIGNKVKITLDGQNEAVTFTDPSNPCNLIMVIVQDDPGSRTITWTDMTIKWAGGTEPTLTTTADGEDIAVSYTHLTLPTIYSV